MARPERDDAAGIHHVGAHSVWTSVLFRDDLDRVGFVVDLARVCAKYEWTCIAFCLMTTHYHLLVETRDESLPLGMQELNFRHAIRFNKRHTLRGHVVDGRYWNERVESESHLLAAYRYIARNPVEAGLCTAAIDWPWCSYRALFDPRDIFTFVDPSAVLACWAPAETALEQLQRFVESVW
ncbi:MAG TPA: transposase [Gaiellaceae bacterium]|nr:transposase [Gaiellaceae bacterium]